MAFDVLKKNETKRTNLELNFLVKYTSNFKFFT